MTARRARVALPRYFRAKSLAAGGQAYFFELPAWARPVKEGKGRAARTVPRERNGRPCPVTSEALGTDLAAAIAKAERLGLQLDEWRLGVATESPKGTIGWLFAWYRRQDRFKRAKFKTRRDYRRWMDVLATLELKKGGKLGGRRASEIQGSTADRLYSRLEEAHGRRSAVYAMQVCRRVWYEAGRNPKETGIVVDKDGAGNPFAKMGLSTKAEKGNRPTSRAEYDLFRAKARELGFQSMATAAAIMFELIRRATDVFGFEFGGEEATGTFFWENYVPGATFAVRQGKTGTEAVKPLRGDDGRLLYPDLEDELARTPRGAPDREMNGRPVTSIVVNEETGERYTEDQAGDRFRAIRDAAGLPADMTLTGFRHGGATELGDAGVEDIRPVSDHKTRASADVYNKVTERKSRDAAGRRRDLVERRA